MTEKRKLTEEQKEILRQNPNVEEIGKVSIYYKKEFIQLALDLDNRKKKQKDVIAPMMK